MSPAEHSAPAGAPSAVAPRQAGQDPIPVAPRTSNRDRTTPARLARRSRFLSARRRVPLTRGDGNVARSIAVGGTRTAGARRSDHLLLAPPRRQSSDAHPPPGPIAAICPAVVSHAIG